MSKYFDILDTNIFSNSDGYYIYIGGRDSAKSIYTITMLLEFLFGGRCEYQFDPRSMIHHYLIKMMI